MFPTTPRLVSILLATAVFGAGCGPFGYIKRTATDATKAVSEAEASNAERQQFAKYLTLAKIKLENAIAVVRQGEPRQPSLSAQAQLPPAGEDRRESRV